MNPSKPLGPACIIVMDLKLELSGYLAEETSLRLVDLKSELLGYLAEETSLGLVGLESGLMCLFLVQLNYLEELFPMEMPKWYCLNQAALLC
uniref:Uncharacterized protein n=1 Tax=Plectus sambesii TaxID=2011161 RepID=A0A914WMR8_9BILA